MSLKRDIEALLLKTLEEGGKNLPRDVRIERRDVTQFAVAGTIRPELLKAIAPEYAEKVEKSLKDGKDLAKSLMAKLALGTLKDGSAITPKYVAKLLKSVEGDAEAIVKSMVDDGCKLTAGTVALIKSAMNKSGMCKAEGCKTMAKEAGYCAAHADMSKDAGNLVD